MALRAQFRLSLSLVWRIAAVATVDIIVVVAAAAVVAVLYFESGVLGVGFGTLWRPALFVIPSHSTHQADNPSVHPPTQPFSRATTLSTPVVPPPCIARNTSHRMASHPAVEGQRPRERSRQGRADSAQPVARARRFGGHRERGGGCRAASPALGA